MGAPPRNERQRPAPGNDGPFVIPPTENPIVFGANRIKAVARVLVQTDLSGVLPPEGEYLLGQYHQLSPAEPGNDSGSRKVTLVLSLSTSGEFVKGSLVSNRKDPTPLEIVRYGPEVIDRSFKTIQDWTVQQRDPHKVSKSLDVLKVAPDTIARLRNISAVALQEMGETPSEPVQEEDETAKYERFDASLLEAMIQALSLYHQREDVIRHISEVALSSGRARVVEEEIAGLLKKVTDARLFNDGTLARKDPGRTLQEPFRRGPVSDLTEAITVNHGEESWNLTIAEGRVMEFHPWWSGSERFCPEHLIDQAKPIATAIVASSVASVYPNLPW